MQDSGSLHYKTWRDQATSFLSLAESKVSGFGGPDTLFSYSIPPSPGAGTVHLRCTGVHTEWQDLPRPGSYSKTKKSRRGSEGPPAGFEGESRKN